MESEKVKEIKKALERCINDCSGNSCPYDKYEKSLKCIDDLQKDALTLINELESENETIKFNMQETEKASFNINQMNGNLVIENQQLKDRIAELESERSEVEMKNNIRLALLNIKLLDEKKQLKYRIAELEKGNEALSFAERLKEN